MKNEIQQKVFETFQKYTNSKITLESEIKQLNIDSLDLVQIVVDLEDIYNLSISDDELLKIKNVKDVLILIEKNLEK